MALDKALSLDPETSALLLVFSTGALVGLQTLRTFVATQLGYKVHWNISIKEPRNTGFPDRMISYFFPLSVKASILRFSGQKLSYFIFPRGAFIYQTSSFDRRLWRTAK